VNHAKDLVFAERANLLAQEQTSFVNAVNAYVGVIENQELLQLTNQSVI
jgi:outer membrane protein